MNIIAKTDWTEARGAVPYRLYIAGGKSLSNLDARSFVKAVTSESRNEFAKGNRMVFPRIACRLLLLFVLAWAWKMRRGARWRKREMKRHNETRFKIASKGEETAARKIAVHGESDG